VVNSYILFLSRSGGVMAIEVMGLPPIKAVAAGNSHCLMTDGERVWAMGSWLLSSGQKVRDRLQHGFCFAAFMQLQSLLTYCMPMAHSVHMTG